MERVDTKINNRILKNYFCNKPFEHFEVGKNGDVYVCCQSWLPLSIGNFINDNIKDIWNSENARKIRQSIHDGSFRYCNKNICPDIQSGVLPLRTHNNVYNETDYVEFPTEIVFSNDKSCNLWCPSCRSEKVLNVNNSEYQMTTVTTEKMYKIFLEKPTDKKFELFFLATGDPFVSKPIRELLYKINGSDFPNLEISLQTNGQLFNKRVFSKMEKIHNNLKICSISVDAITRETYENKVRLGGNWNILLRNIDHLYEQSIRLEKLKLLLIFVVQYDNYTEMAEFCKIFLRRYPHCHIYLTLIQDWGSMSKEIFKQKCIWETTHPNFNDFLEILKDDIFYNEQVHLGTLSKYVDKAHGKI